MAKHHLQHGLQADNYHLVPREWLCCIKVGFAGDLHSLPVLCSMVWPVAAGSLAARRANACRAPSLPALSAW